MINVVGFAGAVGSNKGSLAVAVAAALPSSELRSFGDVVSAESRARGRSDDRNSLQETGLELVDAGFEPFVDLLLSGFNDCSTLVVDGVRHIGAFREVCRRFPHARHLLVFVDIERQLRARRMQRRGESIRAETHPVESELPQVLRHANLVLNGVYLEPNRDKVLEALL